MSKVSIYDKNETMRVIGDSVIYTDLLPEGIARKPFEDVLKAHDLYDVIREKENEDIFQVLVDVYTLGCMVGNQKAKRGI